MVDRAVLRVEKRDGREEGLRATKLARSIHLALRASGLGSVARALELSGEVLGRLEAGAREHRTRSAEIAAVVERILLASGHAGAARAYRYVGRSRRRRRPLFGRVR